MVLNIYEFAETRKLSAFDIAMQLNKIRAVLVNLNIIKFEYMCEKIEISWLKFKHFFVKINCFKILTFSYHRYYKKTCLLFDVLDVQSMSLMPSAIFYK